MIYPTISSSFTIMSYLSCELTSDLAFPRHLTRLKNGTSYVPCTILGTRLAKFVQVHTDTCQLTEPYL